MNNTLVFGSQGRIPARTSHREPGRNWSRPGRVADCRWRFCALLALTAVLGCHRAPARKNLEPTKIQPSWSTESSSAARGGLAPLVLPAVLPSGSPSPGQPGGDSTAGGVAGSTDSASSGHPAPGGSLRLLIDSEPTHFNPLLESEASASQIVFGTVYEPLIGCPAPVGGGGTYEPVLADHWEVSPDGLQITLHLRPGARWHDGHLLNVLDVQASLEPFLVATRPASAFLRASLADLSTIELLPERTVRLVLKRPSGYVLRALCDIPILPDHLLRGPTSDPALLARQPIGTGPFRFVSWERGKRVRLARFPDYWGGPARLAEVVFEFDPDGARALSRTRRGDVDVLLRVLPSHFPDEVDSVTLHGTLTLWRMTPERWAYVAVNQRHPPLGDGIFRRALSSLWDREHFARDLHHGLAHPIWGPPYAPSSMEPAAPLGNRAQALAELEAGGYGDSNTDGVRDVNGVPIRLSLLVASGSRAASTEARAFVLEARKAGILIDSLQLDATSLMARVKKGDFDLAMLLWEGRPDEDPSLLFGSAGPFNNFGYHSPEVDTTLDALRLAPDPVARRPLLNTLTSMLARDQPVLFLYRFDRLILVANRVHDLSAVGDRVELQRTWTDP